MRLNGSLGQALVVACAVEAWGCGDGRLSPVSPMSPSSLTPAETARTKVTLARPRDVDNDGDGYEDPEPGPMPNPGQPPPPDPSQVPTPDPSQAPVVVTVNIVGSFGNGAFVPNPLQASIGNTIVWTNSDVVGHIIFLDNGTMVGNLAPGQSSVPIPLTSPTATYHCTIHPSMTGQVIDPAAAPSTAPPDQSQPPIPDPSASPPPTDPYEDPYYLKVSR